jgi:MerR family transcriptional regulator, thiopeptide resistance regulator
MSWSIAQVARMSGTTSRTLRHYDAMGLLPPAYVGSNGYRYYERDQLLRLQEILLLRELGLGLDAVGSVLDEPGDRLTVLRRHRRMLVRERDRLQQLVVTIGRTIEELEGGEEMTEHPEQWFEGFDADKQRAYEAEARELYGDEVVDDSKARMASWTKQDVQEIQEQSRVAHERIAALMDAGVAVDDPRTLDAVDLHYRWVSRFWTPNAESYTGLGRLYVDDPRFTENIDGTRSGLSTYLRDAMAAYASARLA